MKPEDFSVGIGLPVNRDFPWQTAVSLYKTCYMLGRLGIPANVRLVSGSSLANEARNVVLQAYLNNPENFLFWIDSDVTWAPEDFIRTLRKAKDLGVVCGTYPIKREPVECVVNFVEGSPPDERTGCLEITGVGLGFTCIRRDIVLGFAATKGQKWHSTNNAMVIDAFRIGSIERNGRLEAQGEDGAFFADLRALGHRIWLDPALQIGHVGDKEYKMPMVDMNSTELNSSENKDV